MSLQIESKSVSDIVQDSNSVKDNTRNFAYNLNDKQVKAKLVKGSQREAFSIEEKSNSVNLIFSVGSWAKVVLPTISYMNGFEPGKSINAGSSTIEISSVKCGKEVTGKHIDTQITFLVNEQKAVAHFYNTTQLIMTNSPGYRTLIFDFLVPFFKEKIESLKSDIELYNKNVLETLNDSKVKVKRGAIKYSKKSIYSCNKCLYTTNSITALAKHSRSEHGQEVSTSKLSSNAQPSHSTRNNSVCESILQEKLTISNITQDDPKMLSLDPQLIKFKCKDCNISLDTQDDLDVHVTKHHSSLKDLDVNNSSNISLLATPMPVSNVISLAVDDTKLNGERLRYHPSEKSDSTAVEGSREKVDTVETDDTVTVVSPTLQQRNSRPILPEHDSSVVCPFCKLTLKNLDFLKIHIESIHSLKLKPETVTCISCSQCDFKGTETEVRVHEREKHEIACDVCSTVLTNVSELNNHKLGHEPIRKENFECQYCSEIFLDESERKTHMLNKHEEIVILYTLAKQIDVMEEKSERFDSVQDQVVKMLKNLQDTQNEMKQELFLLRNNQSMSKENLQFQTVQNIEPKKVTKHVENPVNNKEVRTNNNTSSKNLPKKRKEVAWVGTAMSRPIDFKDLEKDLKVDIKVVEIDSIRRGRRGSRKSLKDGVEKALGNHKPDILVLQAGSEEISCLEVKKASRDEGKNFDECRKKWARYVEEDSKAIYKVAEEAVKENSDLEVIIVERLPRYDNNLDDPLKLKQELSTFANTVYKQEWFRKGTPDNIHIVSIPLNCESSPFLQQLIYGTYHSSSFDGFNLNGRGASRHLTYRTKQVITSILESSSKSSHQPGFVLPRKTRKASSVNVMDSETQNVGSYQYSVPVKNRFMGNY